MATRKIIGSSSDFRSFLKSAYTFNFSVALDRFRCALLLMLGTFAFLAIALPHAAAQPPCIVQSATYNFPSAITPGQQITVESHIVATCVQWPPYLNAYSIRVDLNDQTTNYVLSSATYQVGYSQTNIDHVFSNTATAPNSPGTWLLRVDVYFWGGDGQVIIHTTDYAKLQVG
jgi:hypothetical protein